MESVLQTSARMKTIGVIGGASDVATAEYYKVINQSVRRRLGGYHTAKIIINSMDVGVIVYFVKEERWEEGGRHIRGVVSSLESAGADFVICVSNTWHRASDVFMQGAKIPLLHIADTTAAAVKAQNLKRVGLLGTRATMSGSYLRDLLTDKHGLEILVPAEPEQREIDWIIFEELSMPVFKDRSRRYFLDVLDRLQTRGAQGVILGCTEISLLVKQQDRPDLPLFDTLVLHAEAAAEMAISG